MPTFPGDMHGMFFCLPDDVDRHGENIREWWKSWKVIFVVGEIAVFFYHLVCGVNFLMYAVMGQRSGRFLDAGDLKSMQTRYRDHFAAKVT